MLTLVDYAKQNHWANSVFRQALKDDFDKFKDEKTPYGTFAELVYHIPSSVYFWFKRTGKFHFEIKKLQEMTDVNNLFSMWENIDQEWINCLINEDPNTILRYTTSKGKEYEITLDKLVNQLNNHQYYHRGHIAYFSRLNGKILPQTDALVYYRTV